MVEAVGDQVTYVRTGDHLSACLSVFCGQCEYCLTGRPALCASLETRRGPADPPKLCWQGTPVLPFANLASHAEYMLLHEHAVVKIREDMPLDRAAILGCGVTTGLGTVLNTARIEPICTIAVFGCVGVGLAAVQGARVGGARLIIAVDVVGTKLALARELGATRTVDASATDPVAAVREITGGGVDYAFEAVGLKALAELALEALAPGGTATIIGMIPVGEKVRLEGRAFPREKKIQSSAMGSNRFRVDLPRYIELYLQGRLACTR